MKATFLERKLHAIELLSQLENENLLTVIEQLLRDCVQLDVSNVPYEVLEEELEEEDIIELWKWRYEA